MSIVTSSANRWWTFSRQTAFLVDAVVASASVAVDRQPTIASHAQVTIASGTTGSGTVIISGTDSSDDAISETLTFGSNGTQVTTKRFKSITSITTSGLSDEASPPTFTMKAVSADGTTNLIRYSSSFMSSKPVVFNAAGSGPSWPALRQGSTEIDGSKVLLAYEEVWDPRVGDIVTDDASGDLWEVDNVREIRVGFGQRPTFWELRCSRYKT